MIKKLCFLIAFFQTLSVSAYTHSGNPTASGVMPQVGHCAADQINGVTVPFGSKITLPSGRLLIVTDRFGGNYNNRLDVFMNTEKECWEFGRRNLVCKVEVAE